MLQLLQCWQDPPQGPGGEGQQWSGVEWRRTHPPSLHHQPDTPQTIIIPQLTYTHAAVRKALSCHVAQVRRRRRLGLRVCVTGGCGVLQA